MFIRLVMLTMTITEMLIVPTEIYIFPECIFYQPKQEYNGQAEYWWLRSPYVYYRDDYHVYFVRSDGDVDNNNVVWDDSYGKNRSPAFGTDSGTLLPDTSGEIGGWGDFNNAIKYSYG